MSLQGRCKCGSSDPSKFFIIKRKEELYGISCMRRTCGAEFLIDRFCRPSDHSITFNGQLLHFNPPASVKKDPEFQVRLSRKRIKDVRELKPGDHIGFDRKYLIWHHAIVVEAQANPFKLVVDGWDGSLTKMRRVRKNLEKRDVNNMYKFFYSRKIEKENPPELVLARSESRLHPDGESAGRAHLWRTGEFDDRYVFFKANCEHFATSCKTGDNFCNQNRYLLTKMKEATCQFFITSGKTSLKQLVTNVGPDALENLVQKLLDQGSNFLFEGIGLAGVVLIELLSFKDAYSKLKDQLKSGEIDKGVYHVELAKKVMEFLLVAGIAGGGGLVVASVGGPLLEVVMAPVLMIVAKAANRLLTRFMGDGLLELLGKQFDWALSTFLSIKSFLVATATVAVFTVKNFLVSAFNTCYEGCKKALAWVKKKVCEITKSVREEVGRIVENAKEWLSRGWNWLGNKIVNAKHYLVAKLNQCLKNCKQALYWMNTKIKDLTKYVGSNLKKFGLKVVESVADNWKWLQEEVDDSRKYLFDKFNQCWKVCTTIPTKISKATNYVGNKVCQVASCVRNALAKPISVVANAASKLFSWFSSWW